MTHDLVIRGGTVVDGTGAAPRTADVAIDGDRVTEVGRVGARGRREVDADGAVVTPGFVDVHTHLDAQIGWDPLGTSSCWHGVTSVVLGNCGVTFAPCRPEDRPYLAELMESVEDIPARSILSGLAWDWEGYGDYLASVDRLPKGLNVGGMVGHCAVRQYAMGERGLDPEPASADDIATMADLVDEAIAAGALGFSTSRTMLHRVPDGRPVPGTFASTDELYAIGDVLGKHGRGVFEVAPGFSTDLESADREVEWMAEVNRRTGRPVTFGMTQTTFAPDLHHRVYDAVDREAEAGGIVRPQTTPRGISLLFGLAARSLFDRAPGWAALQELDMPAKLAALRDPERRDQLMAEGRSYMPPFDFAGVYVLDTEPADYVLTPERSLAAAAERAGEDVVEAFVRISLESEGRALFSWPFLNQSNDEVERMLRHPATVLGLADSGAHVRLIMDAGQPTWILSHLVRDRGFFSLEDAVRRLTSEPAELFGVVDRGTLLAGSFADANVIDVDSLALDLPTVACDFPGGAGRYVQRGHGYETTVVNGEVFMEKGEHSGALAGRTLRSGPDERQSTR
jgi:N-acyl-D-aspartate/D-glutamate deacylase